VDRGHGVSSTEDEELSLVAALPFRVWFSKSLHVISREYTLKVVQDDFRRAEAFEPVLKFKHAQRGPFVLRACPVGYNLLNRALLSSVGWFIHRIVIDVYRRVRPFPKIVPEGI
jgi:hypothetical protein